MKFVIPISESTQERVDNFLCLVSSSFLFVTVSFFCFLCVCEVLSTKGKLAFRFLKMKLLIGNVLSGPSDLDSQSKFGYLTS